MLLLEDGWLKLVNAFLKYMDVEESSDSVESGDSADEFMSDSSDG